MSYYGDFPVNHTSLVMVFDTFAAATGAPTAASAFANTDIQIYKDGSTTQRSSSAGIVVSTSFDSNTGLQLITVDLSDNTDAGFYAAGHEYSVAVADITADGQTLRFWLGEFSIERANGVLALLKGNAVKVDVNTIKTNAVVNGGTVTFPTNATLASTANITAATGIDVTKLLGTAVSTPATAGILDVNIKNMNNVAATAITTIKAVQGLAVDGVVTSVSGAVGSVTGAVGSVTGAVGSVIGNVGGSVASVVGAVGSVTGAVGSVTAAVTMSAASVQAVWDALTTALTTAGSVGKRIADFLTGDAYVRIGTAGVGLTNLGDARIADLDVAVSTRMAAASYTAPLDAADTRSAVGLASANLDTQLAAVPTALQNADALLSRDLGSGSGAGTLNERTVRAALRAVRNFWSVVAGVLTVTKEDDTTTAWTAAVGTTAGDPVSSVDPT